MEFYFKEVHVIASTIPTKARHCGSVQRAVPLFQPSFISFLILQPCFISFPVLQCLGMAWAVYAFAWLFPSLMQHWFIPSEQIFSQRNICPFACSSVHQKTSGTGLFEQNARNNSLRSLKASSTISQALIPPWVMFVSWPQSHLQLNVDVIEKLAKIAWITAESTSRKCKHREYNLTLLPHVYIIL